MKLVDTSSWIHQLRRGGSEPARERVEFLLRNGEAAWCAPVRLELWSGVGRDPERKVLREFSEVLPDLPITPVVWEQAEVLAERGRRQGLSAPAMDILIASCARHYSVDVEHDDAHFNWLMSV